MLIINVLFGIFSCKSIQMSAFGNMMLCLKSAQFSFYNNWLHLTLKALDEKRSNFNIHALLKPSWDVFSCQNIALHQVAYGGEYGLLQSIPDYVLLIVVLPCVKIYLPLSFCHPSLLNRNTAYEIAPQYGEVPFQKRIGGVEFDTIVNLVSQ